MLSGYRVMSRRFVKSFPFTAEGFGVARDRFSTKPCLVAETDDWVAIVSEGIALAEAFGDGADFDTYELAGGESLPGLGIVDLRTVREPGPRLIGNVVINTTDFGGRSRELAGFENHGGRTYLGDSTQPLGRVLAGHGNNGRDGMEGVRFGRAIGTYLHGPLLPKNAWLADTLIAWALERATGAAPELAPLDDTLEAAAHESARQAALRG
jgi:CobQ-like glutamine amidotransferase family enzyme